MASIIIPASKSITITNKLPDSNINGDTIVVGNDGMSSYFSYLFFDLSPLPSNISVSYAELTLFKTDNFHNDVTNIFGIYPCDYFSTYTTFKNRPKPDPFSTKHFYPITSEVAVKIPLTYFVSGWISNPKRSTCVQLFAKSKNTTASFGSAINKDDYLIPFLKVSFTPIAQVSKINNAIPTNNPPTSNIPVIEQVQVTGTIAANAKYNAVVNVAVKRHLTGYTDNYYVVDEYDNIGKSTPLHIDRTYNIAVTPKPEPTDDETIILGGSYSD
ncbi:DNRLRE domain-containing protein [Clostridium sp. YIM B02505]|uniref:DNRLRE domain-containing protein n=1 Tax=Clostridium yunnanense TaxID=2800325 RepID=A0ABS1EVT4_9CLOT|nr:DNRLRE domain-containing protein [Clostridium yunnanense]MBK1813408.1 DNRLRE domain-containing protein [Clostridium yunnanense]